LNVELLEDRSTPSVSPFDNLNVDANSYDQSHLIVALRPESSNVNLAAAAPDLVQSSSTLDAASGLVLAELKAGISVSQAQAYFQIQSYVRYAQPDYIVTASLVPNDPSFSSQWGLNNTGQTGGVADADIDAPEAWDVATGDGSVVVAVIDTGVDWTHPDLDGNIWVNSDETAGNGIDDDNNGFIDDIRGWDFVNNDNNPMDDNGHGSHVAGIIGAEGNNGTGVSGVIWDVQIMPVKFLNASGSGSLSNAVLALNYAVNNGASISNNSWGGGGYYQPMFDALVAAQSSGHIFVAAAGNASSNNDTTANYPSNYNLDNVVAVASTTSTDGLSSFSNYGANTVELGAPGSSIYSTYKTGGYATLSGTSMATPFVTGAMALVKNQHPDWGYRQIIDQVLNNTDPIASLQGKTITGGRLNLYKALTGGQSPGDTLGPKVTAAAFSGVAANSFDRLRVTFNEAIDPNSFDPSDIASFQLNGTDIPNMSYQVNPVSGSGDKQFDITFAAQFSTGTYTMTIGPNITDVAGNLMDQNGDGTADQYTASGTISTTTTFDSKDVPKNLPDRSTTTSVLNVGQSLTIGKITVKLNITHTYDSDLRISLKSPAGTTITLVNRRGGSGDNFTDTVFDSDAAVSITSGTAPFTGTYRPEQSLTAFNTQNASGTWSLIIRDMARTDVGRLNSWSITITPANGGNATKYSDGFESGGEVSKPESVLMAFAAPSAPQASAAQAPAPSASEPVRLFDNSNLSDSLNHEARESESIGALSAAGGDVSETGTTGNAGDWLDYDAGDAVSSDLINLD
jgi:subtilisin family serine protease/subtilisin-like proprotein convertase family protein